MLPYFYSMHMLLLEFALTDECSFAGALACGMMAGALCDEENQ